MAKLYTVFTSLDCANTPVSPEIPRRPRTSTPGTGTPQVKDWPGHSRHRRPASAQDMAGCTGCSSTEVGPQRDKDRRRKHNSSKTSDLNRNNQLICISTKDIAKIREVIKSREKGKDMVKSKDKVKDVKAKDVKSKDVAKDMPRRASPYIQNQQAAENRKKRYRSNNRGVTLVAMKQGTRSDQRSSSSMSHLSNPRNKPHQPRRAHSANSLLEPAGQEDIERLLSEDDGLEQALATSMLQQILRDMFIDPDLLAELDEEQKQMLFCKMREEQVRRWKEREDKLDGDEKKNSTKKPKKPGGKNKKVDWLIGKDGKPWTWVMGEHKGDKPIEQILEEEAQAKAEAQAEKEAEELRKKAEEEEEKKLKEEEERLRKEAEQKAEQLRISKQKAEEEKRRLQAEKESQAREEALRLEQQQQEQLQQIKRRHELQRRQSIDQVEEIKHRRSMEIYSTFKETRKVYEQQAEEIGKIIEEEWQEQEKKAKAAEQEKREIARRAREEHRRSIKESFKQHTHMIGTITAGLKEQQSAAQASGNKPLPPPRKPRITGTVKVRPAKPADKQAIIDWFRDVERPKGSGYDTKTKKVAPWFHGVISRQAAEDLLQDKPEGTFLIRVSERIWGYAISYRGKDKCKHFLIDTSDGTYRFFGTNQISHNKLADLVHFHKARPISAAGLEKLLQPCPQQSGTPDYAELFPSTDNASIL